MASPESPTATLNALRAARGETKPDRRPGRFRHMEYEAFLREASIWLGVTRKKISDLLEGPSTRGGANQRPDMKVGRWSGEKSTNPEDPDQKILKACLTDRQRIGKRRLGNLGYILRSYSTARGDRQLVLDKRLHQGNPKPELIIGLKQRMP